MSRCNFREHIAIIIMPSSTRHASRDSSSRSNQSVQGGGFFYNDTALVQGVEELRTSHAAHAQSIEELKGACAAQARGIEELKNASAAQARSIEELKNADAARLQRIKSLEDQVAQLMATINTFSSAMTQSAADATFVRSFSKQLKTLRDL